MDELEQPKSFRDMTAAERQALLRRRDVADVGDTAGLEIGGGERVAKRLAGVVVRALAWLAVATLFVAMFFHFTASWRVAMAVVAFMLAWMLAIGKMTEGKADQLD